MLRVARLLRKDLICRHQHDFLQLLSTGTQLVDSFNDWTTNIGTKLTVDVIYTDFEAVIYRNQIIKLISYGMG